MPAAPELPGISREELSHLWHRPSGLARVDWGLANRWIGPRPDVPAPIMRRAVMAACLDEVRDSLTKDHRRWRSLNVEGLAPLDGQIAHAIAKVAERCYAVLRRDLKVVRGDGPMAPIAIVCVEPVSAYVDFTESYFPDEGEFAMSGGLYLNEGPDAFGLIAVNSGARHGVEQAIAHELTHHALHGLDIPLFIEEGFTQMMEERVVGQTNFKLDREVVERQRERWDEESVERFVAGEAFLDAHEDGQELAYHLSQWIVRGELTRRPEAFFKFVRMCRDRDADGVCREVLGVDLRELVMGTLGIGE